MPLDMHIKFLEGRLVSYMCDNCERTVKFFSSRPNPYTTYCSRCKKVVTFYRKEEETVEEGFVV